MPKEGSPDSKNLLARFTLAKRGRERPMAYKRPRDRLLENLARQLEIVKVLRGGRDPKEEGFKEHKMFYEDRGRYVVQIRYSNTPLEIEDDADAVEVDTLEQVEDALNAAMTMTKNGYFDEQINRLAGEWAAKRVGKRGPRKPKAPASTEQAA